MQRSLLFVIFLFFLAENTFSSSFEGLFKLAQKYRAEGKYLEAFNLFKDITYNKTAKSLHPEAYLAMGDIYIKELTDLNKASTLYKKLISTYPDHPDFKDAYIKLAKVYMEQNLRKETHELFKEFEKNFPEDTLTPLFKKIISQPETEKKSYSKKTDIAKKVRVLLKAEKKSLQISSTGGMKFHFPKIPDLSLKFKKGEEVEILNKAEGSDLTEQDNLYSTVSIKPLPESYLTFNGIKYRGTFLINNNKGAILLINIVDIEEYLYGVIPKEVPANWPAEALKAQAVASRTYAIYNMTDKANSSKYDLFSTIMSQVYGGISKENTFTNKAVNETRGEILTFKDMPALTMFHSNSGGMCAGIDEVWEIEIPYLTTHRDDYSNNQPPFRWISGMPKRKIKEKLNTFGLNFKEIKKIVTIRKSKSGRVSTLKIIGKNTELFLNGNSFRLMVTPYLIKSTKFQVEDTGKNFIFSGKGFGHGVGMSQWGACMMAKSGHTYKEILKFYYPDTSLSKIPDVDGGQLSDPGERQ